MGTVMRCAIPEALPHKDISSGLRDQIAYFKRLGFFSLINGNPGREVAWHMGGTKLCGARTMDADKRVNVLLLEGGMHVTTWRQHHGLPFVKVTDFPNVHSPLQRRSACLKDLN